MNFSPVVLFVYNRPYQTTKVLESLSDCKYAEDTILYIFSDAAKNSSDKEKVSEVRQIIKKSEWKKRFKRVSIIEAEKNKGLANSIISGVDKVINKYGCAIIVEDDNNVAYDFLDYMNRGLDFYKDNKKIGFILAYTAPIKFPNDYKKDVFAMGRGSSYAWATWADRWNLVDWDVKDYEIFKNDRKKRKLFDVYGKDRSYMLDNQMNGTIDSWAIRFGYSMFKNQMLAILPVKTRVENIGFDGSGIHNKANDTRFLVHIDKNLKPVEFQNVEVDPRIRKEFVKLFNTPLKIKIKRFIKKIVYKNKARSL